MPGKNLLLVDPASKQGDADYYSTDDLRETWAAIGRELASRGELHDPAGVQSLATEALLDIAVDTFGDASADVRLRAATWLLENPRIVS